MPAYVILMPLILGLAGSAARAKWLPGVMVLASLGLLAGCAVIAAGPFWQGHWSFLNLTGYDITIRLGTASLADWMAVLTALINLCAQLYSLGYFAHDPRQGYFQSVLLGFTGAMLLMVFGQNLFTQFVGWEFMGVGSYLLVGYFRSQPLARYAASKAMLVTRIGDVFFLLAVVLAVAHHQDSLNALNTHGSGFIAWALLIAVAAKSAQGPNASWLLDAMAGPTPASALIHAATMVAAGPYLLIRYSPLLERTPHILLALILLGGSTAILAAWGALGAQEAKRLLAFSTVSQLGMMILAIGLGSWRVAWALLVAHAFYKALLFFVTGIASHRAGSGALSKLRGSLGRWEIGVLLASGVLGVSGLPPTGGYVAKEALYHISRGSMASLGIDLMLSLLGGAYSARLFQSFIGQPEADRTRSASWMLLPAVWLSFLVVLNFFWHPWVSLMAIPLQNSWPSLVVVGIGVGLGAVWAKPFQMFSGKIFLAAWQAVKITGRTIGRFDQALSDGLWDTRIVLGWVTRVVQLGASGRAERYVLISGIVVVLFLIWNMHP